MLRIRRPCPRLHVLAIGAVALLLAACSATPKASPGDAKANQVERVIYVHHVRFVPGTVDLAPGELPRLEARLRNVGREPSGRQHVIAARAGVAAPLAERRAALLSAYLARQGAPIVAVDETAAALPPDLIADPATATVLFARYIVTAPECPDWRKPGAADFNNRPSSNFGCASEANFGLMIADPADLVRGRDMGPADGEAAVLGIQRYRKGEAGKKETAAPPPVFMPMAVPPPAKGATP
ncbi:MAG: hypothetical protein HY057_09525 [Rhodospirillales bacterium]|nr:hypothetical protein [Rhodospirillales bacterium]